MKYPEIRIRNSLLLNSKIIPLLRPELDQSGRQEEADNDFIDKKVGEYIEVWEKYEQKIVHAMCAVLDLEFKQNIVDVYAAPFSNSFSDPMVISTKYSSSRMVDVLIHELTHRLLTDNNKLPMGDGKKLSEHWQALFGEHSFKTLVHIPVHAMLEYIFIDVLDEPNRLDRDIEFCKNYEPYDEAWKYVQHIGYKDILERLKLSYDTK